MTTLYRPELCWAAMQATSADEVIGIMGQAMTELGLVQPSFVTAVCEREGHSPTGLPMPGRKVAVPHADPEHVIDAAIGVATLPSPVPFREMGNPDSVLEVELVLLLALKDRGSIQQELVHLVQAFQNEQFVDQLVAAADRTALHALLLQGTALERAAQ